MDYEIYQRIQKGKRRTLAAIEEEELPWAWFVSCVLTKSTGSAAALLRVAWKSTVFSLSECGECPRESFRERLAKELYLASETLPQEDDLFSFLAPPTIASKFDGFVQKLGTMEPKEKRVYLLNKFGGLGEVGFSELLGISSKETKEYLYSLEQKLQPQENGKAFAKYILLANEFRYTNKRLFEAISVPHMLHETLEHDYKSIFRLSQNSTTVRKDSKNMAHKNKKTQAKQSTPARPQAGINRRAAEKKKKTIIMAVIAVVLIAAIIIAVVSLSGRNNLSATTRTTTYDIEAITTGTVSTTISGSSSLTPITKETLTLVDCIAKEDTATDTDADTGEDPSVALQSDSGTGSGMPSLDSVPVVAGVISDVTVIVGATVSEGDVLATLTLDDESTVELLAPYDAVLLEFYLQEGAEVTMTSNVAMFMGTDGYTMSISVDENNISVVELGQKATISIDAVPLGEDEDEESRTGSVTNISYNGSTNGSTTAYGITVTFPYVAGTYPGMSVSAEIVIEESDEGLLAPVDAVYTSGDTQYVYLAPNDATEGETYKDGELDTSRLVKVTVETGMSDGSYIVIESSELASGDLVVITTVTSTATGSESSGSNSGMGGFGGMGGGGMGGFPGGGNFDFGNFDPSQFGGGFPGMN